MALTVSDTSLKSILKHYYLQISLICIFQTTSSGTGQGERELYQYITRLLAMFQQQSQRGCNSS